MNTKPRAPLAKRSGGRRRPRRGRTVEDPSQSIEALRSVLVGPDRARIERLESPAAIAAILPEAIREATRARERELGIALEPTVTRAVTAVARQQPELYVEVLAPSIGASVRKAVADALSEMLERFNVALERSLSVRSIRWRFEARRTGRSFAEVVLLHTVKYRVEQVFLIHSETSLVLRHLIDAGLPKPSVDQIAAMLSAIDAFGREAFGLMTPEAHLSKFELGELSVWIAYAPPVTLAAVVRGAVASEIGEQIREALARVRIECAADLREFSGDTTRFEVVEPVLEPLLRMQRRPPPRRAQKILVVVAAVVALALVVTAWSSRSRHEAAVHRQAMYADVLETEPGIVVDRAASTTRRLSGFRDPLAPAPEAVLERRGLAPVVLDFVPFLSLDPRIMRRRADHVLEPPPTTQVEVDGTTLRLTGIAPRKWLDDARILRRTLAGIERIDDRGLRVQESVEAVRAAAAEVDTVAIPFEVGQWRIGPAQTGAVKVAAQRVDAAMVAADEARVGACVTITGHADPHGADEHNLALSAKRASAVAAHFASLGIDAAFARIDARQELIPPRRPTVTLRLELDEAGSSAGCGATP